MIPHSEKFLITAELVPPKGTDAASLIAGANALKGKVDAITISDNPRAIMRMSSLAACKLILDAGVEVIMTVTCRDRNRLALQSDLLGAAALGITSVLCVTGDHTTLGDHKGSKPVFDVDSVQLLQIARSLEHGKDMNGKQLSGSPEFLLASTVNPFAYPMELQLIKFEKKIEAGAELFLTQAVFDLAKLADFMEHARRHRIKVLTGIWVLTANDVPQDETARLPGFLVPEDISKRVREGEENGLAEGITIAADLIKAIKNARMADGVHLMTTRGEKVILEVLEKAGV